VDRGGAHRRREKGEGAERQEPYQQKKGQPDLD